MRHKIISE